VARLLVLRTESQHLEWLSVGDSFGQAALVNPEQRRPVSMVAGDGGATLLVLDRATFNRLQAQAQQETHQRNLAGATLQAVLAAACWPLLHSSKDSRTTEEAETLAELFAGLEVCGICLHGSGQPACAGLVG
jgi:CRP-like cAMP-binding protein